MSPQTQILNEKNTPLMEQYFSIKQQYPEELVLFQVGDFYELFFEDARRASAFLAIALTKRGKNKGEDIPLCGIPVHALNHYLIKLIKGGFSVVLCDQLSKPQPGTVVERGVTQVFTPGTLSDALLMDEKSASYMLSLFPSDDAFCLIFSELLTAQLFATIVPAQRIKLLEGELVRYFPDEIVVPENQRTAHAVKMCTALGYRITPFALAEEQRFWMHQQLCESSQALMEKHPLLTSGLELLYQYLKHNHNKAIDHFKTINFYEPDDFVLLDSATQHNLEIVRNNHDGSTTNTLFSILDHAKTAMGSRTIKKWLLRPLITHERILQRQEVIGYINDNRQSAHLLEKCLAGLPDFERIVGRIALGRAAVHDYLGLKNGLLVTPHLRELLNSFPAFQLAQAINEKILPFEQLTTLLASSLNDDPHLDITIRHGFDHNLDSLRDLITHGKERILELEQYEIARTGINSLKICYNGISGYYIEVTNTHNDKVPDDYKHLQTLVNRKRFTTTALRELEHNLNTAASELETIEADVFSRIKHEVATHLTSLRHLAQALAQLDALFGLASAAHYNHYVRPTFNTHGTIAIEKGRHPVVECVLGHHFIPNDTKLDDVTSLAIITGPNMGGKSTYLRQVALMCIMAQIGSMVPASNASFSILDRIFTRIGAGDNVAQGKSTFLIEMEETATICTQATEKSLVILDEVGRGTSTNDGIALAQAIVEYIATTIKARCLFATHYHELTHLEQTLSNVRNYHAASYLQNGSLLFSHNVIPGIAQGSFGVHVARLALLPEPIINRAHELLGALDEQSLLKNTRGSLSAKALCKGRNHGNLEHKSTVHVQQSLFESEKEIEQLALYKELLDKIILLDLTHATPRDALNMLWDMQERIKNM